jgi:prephenate dehydrogenase
MRRPVVAVVGLGQIGGSFAAALTRRRLARVVGVTRRPETVGRALRMRIVAEAGTSLDAVRGADVVVLATPVRTLLKQIPEAAARTGARSILTDVGSTKKEILEAFRRARPRAAVVAGHPMAGNEKAGLDGVDPDLFEGRPWVLIPARPSDRRPGALLERLVRGLGARPVWMADPLDHDLKVARVSHIPYLLSYALLGTPETAIRVCGNSFRDATRVALSDVEMVLDFLLTNRAPVRRAADELVGRIRALAGLLGSRDEARLRRLLGEARRRREKL